VDEAELDSKDLVETVASKVIRRAVVGRKKRMQA
jgi:hypothetical protein